MTSQRQRIRARAREAHIGHLEARCRQLTERLAAWRDYAQLAHRTLHAAMLSGKQHSRIQELLAQSWAEAEQLEAAAKSETESVQCGTIDASS